MEDRLLALKKTKNVNTAAPEMVEEYTEEQIKEIHEKYSRIIKTMYAHGVMADTKLLNDAFQFAMEKHKGALRKNKEPYILHPIAVAQILADLGFESDLVAAALLHDVVEDCDVTVEYLTERFGKNVADTVDALSAVNVITSADPEMEKKDVDVLSDVKLLNEIEKNPKAIYVKIADRMHNLTTIGAFPYAKQRAKAQHTREILIPLARKMGVYRLIYELEDLCFGIENPECYRAVKEKYGQLLWENRYGVKEVQDYLTMIFFGDSLDSVRKSDSLSKFILSCGYRKRYMESIFRNVTSQVSNILTDLEKNICKEKVELYDIYFIVKDECAFTAVDVFFHFYQELLNGSYRITVTEIKRNAEDTRSYFVLVDCYNNRYRLFVEKESDYLNKMNGVILGGDLGLKKLGKIDTAEPGESFKPFINVYRKDGTMVQIEEGATILDFAFAIHPEIGICARYALVNKKQEQIPLYAKLNEGDLVEIVHDSHKDNPELNIPHATIRWFEYVRTREATRALSRYLEKHVESAKPLIQVHDAEGNTYEIETGSTVLDFAFLLGNETGLHFKAAYVNKSKNKTRIDKMLGYDDVVKIISDASDTATPKFEWLNIVKTQKAKDALLEYFNSVLKTK